MLKENGKIPLVFSDQTLGKISHNNGPFERRSFFLERFPDLADVTVIGGFSVVKRNVLQY